MSNDKAPDKAGGYVQRDLEQPVQRVIDDKLNDPDLATKRGERHATEVLQEGVEKSLRTQQATTSGAAGLRTQTTRKNLRSAVSKSLKEQPMATLAIVSACSFLLGALWKS